MYFITLLIPFAFILRIINEMHLIWLDFCNSNGRSGSTQKNIHCTLYLKFCVTLCHMTAKTEKRSHLHLRGPHMEQAEITSWNSRMHLKQARTRIFVNFLDYLSVIVSKLRFNDVRGRTLFKKTLY